MTSTDRLNGPMGSVATKAPVQAVSTVSLTLSGLQTVGGVLLAEGDRVLVKDQSDATQNGIYDASSSGWTRSLDFDGNRDVVRGTLVVVNMDAGQGVLFQVTSDDPVIIGESEIDFRAFTDPNRVYNQTAAEAAANITPNYPYTPDTADTLNVFRFMTDAQIAAVLAGTNTDVSAAVQAANDFLEGRAANCILTLNVPNGGSGYTNGTYDCVAMTGGTGTNAKCRIVVSGGAIISVKPAGPQGTNTVNAAGLGNFTVGDSLTPLTDASSTSALYFPAGGSGAVITVATVSAAGGKTASGLPQGGKLYFPPGRYYCGSFALRVGAFVEWHGNGLNSVQFAWATGYTGVGIYFGPDESGIYGFTGYYTMGSVLDTMTINCGASMTWGVLADGVQQGAYIRRVNLASVVNGGISIKDNKGGVFFRMSDIGIVGASVMAASGGQPTAVAMRIEHGGCVELNQYTTNGGGSPADETGIFLSGIDLRAGSLLLSDYQAEEVLNAIDIAAGFLSYAVTVDRMLVANTSFGTPKGIWIRATAKPVLNARGITAGAGIRPIKNDNTGFAPNTGTTNTVTSYIYSGDTTQFGLHENIIPSGVTSVISASGGTFTPDVSAGDWIICSITGAITTVAAPVYGASAMPAELKGRKITLTLSNASGGALTSVTFNAAFHLASNPLPANGKNISADFRWTTAAWYQVSAWTADITN